MKRIWLCGFVIKGAGYNSGRAMYQTKPAISYHFC
jgi:hypothetical protein